MKENGISNEAKGKYVIWSEGRRREQNGYEQ